MSYFFTSSSVFGTHQDMIAQRPMLLIDGAATRYAEFKIDTQFRPVDDGAQGYTPGQGVYKTLSWVDMDGGRHTAAVERPLLSQRRTGRYVFSFATAAPRSGWSLTSLLTV